MQDGAIGKVKEVHTWSNKKWGDPSPLPERNDPVPANAQLGPVAGGRGRAAVHRRRLLSSRQLAEAARLRHRHVRRHGLPHLRPGVRGPGPHRPALASARKARRPNAHNWANDAVVHYVFPGTQVHGWQDRRRHLVRRRPDDRRRACSIRLGSRACPARARSSSARRGSCCCRTSQPRSCCRKEIFADYAAAQARPPPTTGTSSSRRSAATGRPAPASTMPARSPKRCCWAASPRASPSQTLEWDAAALKFTNVPEANQYVRRKYRKGWEVPGLSEG